MIDIANSGEALHGYLARPESGTENGKAVVVLQEYWGLVPHIKSVADRFAAAGFVALAPDLYRGETTEAPDEAGRKMMALDIGRAGADLRGALAAICERAGAGKVGVVGFCMGGQLALLSGTLDPERVGAVVDFYGVHPDVKPDFARLSCPLLAFFAENDEFVSQEAARGLVAAVKDAGKTVEHHTYPGVGHAFFNDARPSHDEAAAADAWSRTLAFFGTHL